MFGRVLVATDFSPHAGQVLECIGAIPGIEEIVLLHVTGSTREREETEQDLHSLAVQLLLPGVPVRTIVAEEEEGDTAGAIVQAATGQQASLVILGAKGKNLLRTLVLGSVSRGVIETCTTDVLVLHFRGEDVPDPSAMEPFCKNIFFTILCPVDFSKPSADLLAFVAGLPRVREVILLHVITVPAFDRDSDALESAAVAELNELKKAYFPSGWVRTLVRHGDPVREIAECARKEDASLVVMSRYGNGDYATNIPLGRITSGVADRVDRPLLVRYPRISLSVVSRELSIREFSAAEHLWQEYRGQKADPASDRIFSVFVEGQPVAVARCKRHPEGIEVDGVFVPDRYRNRGYAKRVVTALVEACGTEPLFMYSTLALVGFYGSFGFMQIPESDLPESIRARYGFAGGNLAGAEVIPMRRPAMR